MSVTIRGTDILFNDGSTQSTSAAVNTTTVLNATAGASVGAVGTYALLHYVPNSNGSPGQTFAGSNLRYSSSGTLRADTAPAGTWRLMGYMLDWNESGALNSQTSLFLRIS